MNQKDPSLLAAHPSHIHTFTTPIQVESLHSRRQFLLRESQTPDSLTEVSIASRCLPVCVASRSWNTNQRVSLFEVTVISVSLPPFVSHRGLSNTNQRLSLSLPIGIVALEMMRGLKKSISKEIGGEFPAKPAPHISSILVPPPFTSQWLRAFVSRGYTVDKTRPTLFTSSLVFRFWVFAYALTVLHTGCRLL